MVIFLLKTTTLCNILPLYLQLRSSLAISIHIYHYFVSRALYTVFVGHGTNR
jgi:hypothetical protein